MVNKIKAFKGRGATINPQSWFCENLHEEFDDGWENQTEPLRTIKTSLLKDTSRTVITYNQSPDLPFDRSINPYRGCEHGCCYCYARPSHAYLDLSPGLDFETRIFIKPNLQECLQQELRAKKYRCRPIVLGANTDPYQPIEKLYHLTRNLLETLKQCQHPVSIVTKASLIERDIDLLSEMAQQSLTAAAPKRRLQTIQALSEAGVPVGVLLAPVIPQLNDAELEKILEQVSARGARTAAYVMLRLPLEVEDIFTDWLYLHYPLKASHVLNCIRAIREGKTNDSRFGSRLTGKGGLCTYYTNPGTINQC